MASDQEQQNRYVIRLRSPVPEDEIDAMTERVALKAQTSEERARKIASRRSGNLTHETTKETAERYAGYLRSAGMDVVVVDTAAPDASPDVAPSAPKPNTTQTASSPIALAALIGANLFPLVGVLYFDWSLFMLLMLYWAENGVIGAFNILKMLVVREGGWIEHFVAWLIVASFFTAHYGAFWFLHGLFVMGFFGDMSKLEVLPPHLSLEFLLSGLALLLGAVPMYALLSLVASHGVSFVLNFLGNDEILRTDTKELMTQPYTRVTILHMTILLGAIGTTALGSPIVALLVLVLLKLVVDIIAHLYEHRALQDVQTQDATPDEAA